MPAAKSAARRARALLFLTRPPLWPAWPYLPVVRRGRGREELGVRFDFRGTSGRTGYSATVFVTNLFLAPADEATAGATVSAPVVGKRVVVRRNDGTLAEVSDVKITAVMVDPGDDGPLVKPR